jgi:phage recombination protein Bet
MRDQEFSREKIELIKRTIAVGASDDELELFLYTAKRTGLDPLARQIYAIKRGGKMTIQTAIDGYRVIADRTGKLAGISDPTYVVDEGTKFPASACVTVKKVVGWTPTSMEVAEFTATARWTEYNAGGPMWQKMPFLMLGKCAEALALRKAFPADLSGLYTTEEMAQADSPALPEYIAPQQNTQRAQKPAPQINPDAEESNDYDTHMEDSARDYGFEPPPEPRVRKQGPVISEAQAKRFFGIAMGSGKTKAEINNYLAIKGYNTTGEILRSEYEQHCEWAAK